MILEVAVLYIKTGEEPAFEKDFSVAGKFIASAEGYISHSLRKCIEQDHKYLLLVEWKALEDHTRGFRGSESYKKWKEILHDYYEPFPVVEHYELIMENHQSV